MCSQVAKIDFVRCRIKTDRPWRGTAQSGREGVLRRTVSGGEGVLHSMVLFKLLDCMCAAEVLAKGVGLYVSCGGACRKMFLFFQRSGLFLFFNGVREKRLGRRVSLREEVRRTDTEVWAIDPALGNALGNLVVNIVVNF